MSASRIVVAPATACDVDGRMIDGAMPASMAISPPKTATALHARPGRHAREPCTRIASAIAIAYAMTSSDPHPVAYTTHAVLIAATAARSCRPHVGREPGLDRDHERVGDAARGEQRDEQPERSGGDQVGALQPRDREDRRRVRPRRREAMPRPVARRRCVPSHRSCIGRPSRANLTGDVEGGSGTVTDSTVQILCRRAPDSLGSGSSGDLGPRRPADSVGIRRRRRTRADGAPRAGGVSRPLPALTLMPSVWARPMTASMIAVDSCSSRGRRRRSGRSSRCRPGIAADRAARSSRSRSRRSRRAHRAPRCRGVRCPASPPRR